MDLKEISESKEVSKIVIGSFLIFLVLISLFINWESNFIFVVQIYLLLSGLGFMAWGVKQIERKQRLEEELLRAQSISDNKSQIFQHFELDNFGPILKNQEDEDLFYSEIEKIDPVLKERYFKQFNLRKNLQLSIDIKTYGLDNAKTYIREALSIFKDLMKNYEFNIVEWTKIKEGFFTYKQNFETSKFLSKAKQQLENIEFLDQSDQIELVKKVKNYLDNVLLKYTEHINIKTIHDFLLELKNVYPTAFDASQQEKTTNNKEEKIDDDIEDLESIDEPLER